MLSEPLWETDGDDDLIRSIRSHEPYQAPNVDLQRHVTIRRERSEVSELSSLLDGLYLDDLQPVSQVVEAEVDEEANAFEEQLEG